MRALVTGASGFIGRHLVRTLQDQGWGVAALVRASSRRDGLAGAEARVGDITDPASLVAAVEGVDVVFHLASLLKMPWKRAFHTVNAEGTRNLAAAVAGRETPPVLVVVSSLAAAGPSPTGQARDERRVPEPVSIYGRVKLAAEAAAAGQRAPISIVRPPMVFGPGDRSAFPIFKTTRRGFHLVPTWSENHLSLIHAVDLARGLIRVAEAGERLPAEGKGAVGQGVYFAADEAQPSYAELGVRIGAAVGTDRVRMVRLPSAATWCAALGSEGVARLRDRASFLNLDKWREATAGSWICDPSKLRGLGWAPEPLSDRLAQTAEWYRQEGWLS